MFLLRARVLVAATTVIAAVAYPASTAGAAVRAPLRAAVAERSAASGKCAPVWFIGARGSGEPAKGNDGMGAPVDHMASVVSADLAAKGLAMAKMPVNYPADSVNDLKPNSAVITLLRRGDTAAASTLYVQTSVNKYDASMDEGIKQSESDVAAVVGQCPDAKIVMAGYSQGAVAVHDAENWLAKNKPNQFAHIAGTLLLGDPDRVPGTKAKLFGDTTATNAKGVRVYFRLVKPHDVPAPATTANIANANDIVGDFKAGDLTDSATRNNAMSVHTSYAKKVKGKMVYEPVLDDAAHWVAARVLDAFAKATVVQAPLPADAASQPSPWIFGVSCASPSFCVAVGSYLDTSGHDEGLILTQVNGLWTAAQAPAPLTASTTDRNVQLQGVSCTSSSFCVAVGESRNASGYFDGLILTWSGTAWTPSQAPVPPDAANNPVAALTGVSCSSSSYCLAVGQYRTSPKDQSELLSWSGGAWTPSRAPLPANVASNQAEAGYLVGVSCVSASSCTAVGSYGDGTIGGPWVLTETGDSWTSVGAPQPSDSTGNGQFWDASCPATSSCVAVGEYESTSSGFAGLLSTGSGSSWTAMSAPMPANGVSSQGAATYGVSCASSSRCLAVGVYSDDTSSEPLLLTKSGSSWTPAEAPVPANAGSIPYASLWGVSCPSQSFCVAGGVYVDTSGKDQLMLVTTST